MPTGYRYKVLRTRALRHAKLEPKPGPPCPTPSTAMSTRRTAIVAAAGVLLSPALSARLPASATESSLREALRRYVDAWNRHDVQAWAEALTEDVRYTRGVDPYRPLEGRAAVVGAVGELVRTTDLSWDIVRLRMRPDSSATVVVRQTAGLLPKVEGRYAGAFESMPSVSRWRYEGGWKMWFFSAHKDSALAAMKEDGVE